jgi:uncharacterized membrane protein
MSPALSYWLYRVALLAHIAGVVVWMGAVAYYLFILRPALRMSGMDRRASYPLLAAIKARLRRVVGIAVAVIVASGLFNAQRRGLLGGAPADAVDAFHRRVFFWKMIVVGVLILTFVAALPLLARVRTGKLRGRLFVLVHVAVLVLGIIAIGAGILLSR